ncbi:RluA family pseudouridine synthase [Enhygromyxa salina]|uniref:Ribosomal large subunit pseudouridine synthase D n=1 Tax=Enhygromyxa salina TaxID=215803 RepID=A0A2S9YS78_9BACT|nr:RluA family pseudouridine synthase [Enhygromyxa salina]PRQ07953.1 Ribosomal large subunit pseudouridine synthase D [Enhygromyxa salina]
MSEQTNDPRRVSCVVTEADADERADVVLGRRIPALSRRQARSLARAGKLRVDGQRQPPATRVRAGQRLELELELAEDLAAPALDQLELLASTEDFIYVHKPAGVHTVALTPAQPGVLATAVAAAFPDCAEASEDPREAGAVHRLDRPTSGVVAFARSREAWSRARAGFSEERVAKCYLAVCSPTAQPFPWPPLMPAGGLQGWLALAGEAAGKFDDAQLGSVLADTERLTGAEGVRIRSAIGPDGQKRSAVRLEGRRASTVVLPLAQHGPHWLVRLMLETGRRHQARVHLAWIGLPILGDPIYGTATTARAAIHLHAFELDLSGICPGERPVYAPPPLGFWPPRAPSS